MGSNKLVFNSRGDSAWVEFANGKETVSWDTKEEALEALNDLFNKDRISEDEVKKFSKEIFLKETFPSIFDSVRIIGAIIALSHSSLEPDYKQIANPTFAVCDCGAKPIHGYFHDDDNNKAGMPVMFKNQARDFTNWLLKNGIVSEEGKTSLFVQIDMTELPEHPQVN
ncbi:hypothetical protein H6790_00855 [Candidatus Nomurabacteria bacterium]|nr:hypothetical protein [Candidatus Nomurabacteria bacterium]MCB9820482.1 hypothetical protein [Candidatus Nomurabacteria bacterium]